MFSGPSGAEALASPPLVTVAPDMWWPLVLPVPSGAEAVASPPLADRAPWPRLLADGLVVEDLDENE